MVIAGGVMFATLAFRQSVGVTILIMFLGALASIWSGLRFFRGERNKAVLSRDGLFLIHPGDEPEHFPWASIADARLGGIIDHIKLSTPDGRTLTTIPNSFLGSRRRTEQLLAAINEWRARHETNQDARPDGDVN
jgi:hypothetical protein